MDAYLRGEISHGWYLCLCDGEIVGGLGVIENDFHDRKDLTPNICAVYTEEAHRNRGIAGRLLDMAVGDLKSKNITPVYLLTDHVGFYERYGWEFYCTVQGSRMYIRKQTQSQARKKASDEPKRYRMRPFFCCFICRPSKRRIIWILPHWTKR